MPQLPRQVLQRVVVQVELAQVLQLADLARQAREPVVRYLRGARPRRESTAQFARRASSVYLLDERILEVSSLFWEAQ